MWLGYGSFVGQKLNQRLKQTKPMETPVDEAIVSLLVAASWLNDRLDRALQGLDVSMAQYNVLRILGGAQPDGHPRCEVARRMIDRAPDVTRLIDRLEARGLVARERDAEDARRSRARITAAGVDALHQATAALGVVEADVARRLKTSEQRELSRLCEALFGPDVEP
jgi:DNA-binding MarR family transcriptional regulator